MIAERIVFRRMHSAVGFCFLTICMHSIEGKTAEPASDAEAVRVRQTFASREAIQHLLKGETDLALKSLAPIANHEQSISISDPEPLSPVLAGLNRLITRLDYEEQYELLRKFTFVGSPPTAIRHLAGPVPTSAPPSEFARALGERPADNSFRIASIGDVKGLFSTGWSLVVAARESGRLKRLSNDLEQLVERKVAGSELLLALARLADDRGNVTGVMDQLVQRTARAQQAVTTNPQSIDASDLVLAIASLRWPTLRRQSEALLAAMVDMTFGQPSPGIRSFVQQTHAIAALSADSTSRHVDTTPELSPRLKYWVPVSQENRIDAAEDSTWLVHEDHLLHLSGSATDSLFLRYPIIGDFHFQCEMPKAFRVEPAGGMSYGGLHFHALIDNGDVTVWNADSSPALRRYSPFAHRRWSTSFNRLSITSSNDDFKMSVNGHPVHVASAKNSTSPWLGLWSPGSARPAFRNFKMAGNPVIPRSVKIVEGNQLHGWIARSVSRRSDEVEPDWNANKGILEAAAKEPACDVPDEVDQRLLSYERPLLPGETISYEFFYSEGTSEVHPALGCVAFLLYPDGVKLHWESSGDHEWTGLPVDNVIVEPLRRRGPRPLPFKPNDWNQIRLTRTEKGITLALNEKPIYERVIDWSGDHRFGFFRNGKMTSAKVRNATLTGDWPEQLPTEFLEHPLATIEELPAPRDRRFASKIFQEKMLASNVLAVRRTALAMPMKERFAYLSDWVLPGKHHAGFRLWGDFTPTQVCPLAVESVAEHEQQGGQIVSPVFDWLDAARELGKLDDCLKRIEQITTTDDPAQQRARIVTRLLLKLEQGIAPATDPDWVPLFALMKKETSVEAEDHWPEVLLAVRAGEKYPDHSVCSEIIVDLANRQLLRWGNPLFPRWQTQFMALEMQRNLRAEGDTNATNKLVQWIPMTAGRSFTFGTGYSNHQWIRQGSRVTKACGHDLDLLFYYQPLSGDFDLECDLVQSQRYPVDCLTAGSYVGLLGDLKSLIRGTLRSPLPVVSFEPALFYIGKPTRYRISIRNGNRSIFMNGRLVLSEPLEKDYDPWVAIRSMGWIRSCVQDMRITGKPNVLETVPMSTSDQLTGWINYFDTSDWKFEKDTESTGNIVETRNSDYQGMIAESLLRYQRPLTENDIISYDFYYEPEKVEVHPALDRLALILDPSGVREHWITDGQNERAEVDCDNSVDLPANRRGPTPLPLKLNQWNHLELILHEKIVRVELNGSVVYERTLDASNHRQFGLFHYRDTSDARVRNVTMRGDWPKELIPVTEQELADQSVLSLDADLSRMKAEFRHDFEKQGIDNEYLQLRRDGVSTVRHTPQGLHVSQSTDTVGTVTNLISNFTVSGDFDLEAAFDQFEAVSKKNSSGVLIGLELNAPQNPVYDISRMQVNDDLRVSHSSRSLLVGPDRRTWEAIDQANEAISGRLRLSRRGTTLYYLFAQGDSESFRLLYSDTVSERDTVQNGIHFQVYTFLGKTSVTWKHFILRAERMTYFPPEGPRKTTLMIVQADGTNPRLLARSESLGFQNCGSPEWSPDGTKIALDMSDGTVANSHIIVIDVDTGKTRDIGTGAMPSFSANGKRLALTAAGKGVLTINSEGGDVQTVDNSGWGAQWSPDGKLIAYGKAGNVWVWDVTTKQSRKLLSGDGATRYSYIYWNLGWSHDSKSIAFKARCRDANLKDELVVIEPDHPEEFKIGRASCRERVCLYG